MATKRNIYRGDAEKNSKATAKVKNLNTEDTENFRGREALKKNRNTKTKGKTILRGMGA